MKEPIIISTGSMNVAQRVNDLFNALWARSRQRAESLIKDYGDILALPTDQLAVCLALDDDVYVATCRLLDKIIVGLADVTPEGYIFGAHVEDPTCIGFWPMHMLGEIVWY